jgi:2-keto-4-pentenoate hydratase/2-oxohepta-3-ene-1,7-dioic acid hydratase in catechol pathway
MATLARFKHGDAICHGVVADGRVTPFAGDLFGDRTPSGDPVGLDDVKLLAPIVPRQLLAVAVNYKSHLGDRTPPGNPELFWKSPSSLIGPDDTIVMPKDAERVDAEGELVAIIGRRCRKVSKDDALDHVLGYTCGNDVSARDWQRGDRQWWRAKSSDTFSSMGPWIVEGLDPAVLVLTTRYDGEEVQKTETNLLIYDVPTVISFVSQVVTLEPGDVIYTGTPGTTRKMEDGQIVEVEISRIGTLRNPVVQETA